MFDSSFRNQKRQLCSVPQICSGLENPTFQNAGRNSPSRRWYHMPTGIIATITFHGKNVAICLQPFSFLQEIDHFNFFQRALGSLGYQGHFVSKPDSPCLYLPENSGPDGCAIFFKRDKFDLQKLDSRVIEVWRVQSNQVFCHLINKLDAIGYPV